MADLPSVAEALRFNLLRQAAFGGTSVEAVSFEVDRDDEGEEAIFLRLTLADPVGETWPLADILAIRHAVLAQLHDVGSDVPVYVSVSPTTDEQQDQDTYLAV